jgi:hypothetical protein
MTKVSRRTNKPTRRQRQQKAKAALLTAQSTLSTRYYAGLTEYELNNPCGKAGMPQAQYQEAERKLRAQGFHKAYSLPHLIYTLYMQSAAFGKQYG